MFNRRQFGSDLNQRFNEIPNWITQLKLTSEFVSQQNLIHI